jgi:hypothetical protein
LSYTSIQVLRGRQSNGYSIERYQPLARGDPIGAGCLETRKRSTRHGRPNNSAVDPRAAGFAEENSKQALEMGQKVSLQLRAAEARVAELEAEVAQQGGK